MSSSPASAGEFCILLQVRILQISLGIICLSLIYQESQVVGGLWEPGGGTSHDHNKVISLK